MKKIFIGLAVLAVCLFATKVVFAVDSAGDNATEVTSTCTMLESIEWAASTYTISKGATWTGGVSGNLNTVNTSITNSVAMTLYYNVPINLDPTQSGTAGHLTEAVNSDTMLTEYKISSSEAELTNDDADYIGIETFMAKTYTITHANGDGAIVLDLGIKATTDTANMPDPGDYTAVVTLTATKTP